MEPHIEDYMRVIPVSTFMGLQSCDYTGYIAQYPELGAFDMSSISATDFITAMPPGKGVSGAGGGFPNPTIYDEGSNISRALAVEKPKKKIKKTKTAAGADDDLTPTSLMGNRKLR